MAIRPVSHKVTQSYGVRNSAYRLGYHPFEHYLVYENGIIISPKLKRPLKTATNHKGYEVVKLYDQKGNKKTIPVHRVVALTFCPNPNNLPQVNHIDGNKQNNRVGNLEWCDNTHNCLHAVESGLNPTRGEGSAVNKYPESLIRRCLETKGKVLSRVFAEENDMPYLYVKAVRGGHRWNWLWRQYNGN